MKYLHQLRKLCHVETRRWLLMVGLVAVIYLSFQSLLIPYGDALRSLLPDEGAQTADEFNLKTMDSSLKSAMIRNPLTVQAFNVSEASMLEKNEDDSVIDRESQLGIKGNGEEDEDLEVSSDGHLNQSSVLEKMVAINDGFESNSFKIWKHSNDKEAGNGTISINDNDFVIVQEFQKGRDDIENILGSDKKMFNEDLQLSVYQNSSSSVRRAAINDSLASSVSIKNQINSYIEQIVISNGNSSSKTSEGVNDEFQPPLPSMAKTIASVVNITNGENLLSHLDDDDLTNIRDDLGNTTRKKMRCEMPPKTVTSIDEMNSILVRHRRSSRAMRPKWSSVRDQEILAARSQIEKSPVVRNDPELYAPLFRNVSMFKRSYELMERTLKVYVYKEGNKPIFHQPIMKGLYASEGWFMKLMEGNKNYAVKDPHKAHLFYMPFSSRMLEHVLYVRNSHNRTNLRQYLKEYTEKIAAKYPYFNRTGGADHFLVACHDWAPYETRHHMERCMKALCNADVTGGFKIGRDVSLPETYVRSGKNPQRDLGGKPPSQRHIFAFYAGNMHGYLRTILLNYWKDKDPDMKILGPMPPGVASKMSYIEYMKSSKYCICPKGYEVNSPRVVESFFYECVPVIISDNFVPPLFDVLNWSAFSVIVAEKDIPRLKEILVSIPEEKYLEMQLGVRKVQRHFLWHAKPVRYDLFHMILHSIWYNRVFQIKLK